MWEFFRHCHTNNHHAIIALVLGLDDILPFSTNTDTTKISE